MRRSNLKDDVAAYIREEIFAGRIRLGAKLNQDEIANHLGVSRIPVREAIIDLNASGLLAMSPGRGAAVADLVPDDVRDHYLIYGTIVGIAAERAAFRRTESDLAALQTLRESLTEADGPMVRHELDAQFHRRVNVVGGTTRLRLILRFLATSFPSVPVFSQVEVEQDTDYHGRVVNALRARDGAQARRRVVERFVADAERVVSVLTANGLWDPIGSDANLPKREAG